jgi:FKBP-type peptidyl-prolyl cis-trans isomerase FklB
MKKLLAMFAILGMVVLGCEGLSSGEKAGVGEPTGKAAPPPEKKVTPAPEKEATPAPEKEAAPAPEKEAAPAPEKEAAPPAPKKEEAPEPKTSGLTDKESKFSYCIGFNVGQRLKLQGAKVDSEVLLRGVNDGLSGGKPVLDPKVMMQIMKEFQDDLSKRHTEALGIKSKQAAEKNKKDGAAFLAENAKKDGVKTVESGLQYRVIKAGNGLSPKKTDKVIVHYRGTTIDGKEFDSSIKRGKPATFPVGGVIPGFSEALQMMKVGAKWEVFIPGDIAYAASPRSPGGPFSTLIFELELIGIEPPAAPE